MFLVLKITLADFSTEASGLVFASFYFQIFYIFLFNVYPIVDGCVFALMVVIVSWMYTYTQTHLVVYIKCV